MLSPCTLQQEDKFNKAFPSQIPRRPLANRGLSFDTTIVLILYYTKIRNISLTGDICTALLPLMLVSAEQTQM
jgi:hypothetical protein